MNREQRRAFVKRAKKRGVKEAEAKTYASIISNGTGNHTEPIDFEEGDKAMLNIEAIKARKNYEKMSQKYREFVESNDGVQFTVHKENKNLISFTEHPQWLFWSGDLLKADCEQVVEANENT